MDCGWWQNPSHGEEKHWKTLRQVKSLYCRHCQNLQSRDAFRNVNTEDLQQDANEWFYLSIPISELRFFQTNEIKINLYQNNGKEKSGEGMEQLMILSIPHHVVEVVLWHGHVWLSMEWVYICLLIMLTKVCQWVLYPLRWCMDSKW